MKKLTLAIYLIFSILFIQTKTFTKTLTSKEDFEINNLKKQIKILENKITQLEKIKKNKMEKNRKNIKIGLALSGGGAKGLAHIGVLKTLESLGIRPDYITGTSIGALIGVLYSAGYSPDQIEQILSKNSWEEFINGDFIDDKIPLEKKINNKNYMVSVKYDNKFNFSLPKSFGNSQMMYFELKKLLNNVEKVKNFDELPIPVRIIATDLNTGEAVVFKEGDLAKSVVASTAIPTIFDPVEINGRLYVDGLVSRNFPVIDVINMGADIVIGSDVGNEIKDKKEYNILSVLNQLVAIQSASSTDEQRKLASILITPDVLKYSATELDKSKLFIELGEKATREKLSLLEELPKNFKKVSIKTESHNKLCIKKLEFKNDISEKNKAIITNSLSRILNEDITLEELESQLLKLYGNEIINYLYYDIEDNDLVLDVGINPNNSVGMGVKYLTDYGTTFDIGTTITNFGKIGNNTLVNLQVGDYLGASFKNFIYYGYSNKIGIFANFNYNENPFFLYKENKKISNSIVNTFDLEVGALTQYNNQLTVAYGVNSSYAKLRQETGSLDSNEIEYSKNYNGAFFKINFDTLNSDIFPYSGIKLDFKYSWEGSFDKSNSTLYGPLYTFDSYFPITKKIIFNYGLSGGVINGTEVTSIDKFIRLGGTKNNLQNKDFAFYGYSYQQKLVKDFLIGKLGISYKLDTNLYLNARWNIGTYSDLKENPSSNKRTIWEDYSQGFNLSLAYGSLLGPIEFSLSKNNEHGEIISQLSIGYVFD
ncbi:patatin-like phospholipase family protein [Fusobacterium sp.]|uniref:patatin-like phospholipase family protein n=1 Tax=Fusobacterium sp. TaxID=68766 RepID=UPI0025C524AB|nr:patatin-like phospholipase family protein [Fusobacterium sp.]